MEYIKVLIAENKPDIIDATKSILEYKGYMVTIAKDALELLQRVKDSAPQLIILDLNLPDLDPKNIFNEIRLISSSQTVPIIALTSKAELEEKISILESGADDFIVKPFDLAEFVARINTIMRRNYYNLDASPLTRLPGNQSILRKMEEHLESQSPFAVSYIDLNNFKAYNDKYGFAKGDEVIKKTARIILECIKELGDQEDFVGHIGGDDFIVISKPGNIDPICLKIIDKFDRTIPNFYDPSDIAKGGITIEDRLGKVAKFPIMSISIGTITNDSTKLTHIGQISALSSELKKYAKSFEGSAYVKDRRVQELYQSAPVKLEENSEHKHKDKIAVLNGIIENKAIDIVLQPIIDLEKSEVFGLEAFGRGPKDTPLEMPEELFRVARIMDKAWEVDHICIEKALIVGRKIKEDKKFFINVACETWLNPKSRSPEFFSGALKTPKNVYFELKLKDLVMDFEQYRVACEFFRSKGFGLSVDDFCDSGFKTLSFLEDLKPDFVKLDNSFVRKINEDPHLQKAMKMIVGVFSNFGAVLIAEQVETEQEKECLIKLGIKYAQGYLFARPEMAPK